MHRLTRQVRFALNPAEPAKGVTFTNGYAANPPLTGLGTYLQLNVELTGTLDIQSSYLLNIRTVDQAVRNHLLPVWRNLPPGRFLPGPALYLACEILAPHLLPATVSGLTLDLSPWLHVAVSPSELHMVRLTQTFEFSAAHRLNNPELSAAANIQTFGKCNNPDGHGHNYQLAVTLKGPAGGGPTGMVMPVPELEAIVEKQVIEHFDHKHLNLQVPEFAAVIPSVENIARVIYERLAEPLAGKLDSVTVWETPKTWCEYRLD